MATLSGNKIKNTYQSLVKFSDNGNITTSAKQLTDGFGNNSPVFVSTTQVGIGVTPESGLNLHIFGDAKIGSNLTVIGNLVVEGSTTTVGTDTLTVKDPLIVLANNNTSTDAVDIGFYGKYTPSGTTLYSGLFREALTGKYRLFKGLEAEPTTTVNTSGTGYAVATLIANLEGNFIGGTISSTGANFSGNVVIQNSGVPTLSIQNTTNNVQGIFYASSSEVVIGSNTNNTLKFLQNGGTALTIDTSQDATFVGGISATTADFSGDVDIDGTLDVDDVISVEGSAFGRIEIGGASGGYIDLKAPNSDDYDLRIITSSGGNEVTTATGDLIFNTAETLALTIDTSQDATFEGDIILSGTVDGRDVATDGAKLDGIESGATADQTAAEIKTAYESNANTNAFTDADETKLNGIEASADVTDATNVLAAGAVMTTGNQSIGGVKTFSDQVTIPATPSASTDAASKGYVDAAVEGQDTLAEILAIGNTTGGTDIAITSGDKITNFTSTGIDDNATSEAIYITSGGKIGIDEDTPLAKLTVNQDSLVDTEGIMVQSGNDAGNGGVAIFKSANLVGSISALGSSSSLTFMTSGGTTALTLDSSQNATFAGDVTVTGGDLTLGTDAIASNINAVGDVLGINVDSNTGGGAGANIQLKTAGTTQLTINSSSATFAGDITLGGNILLNGGVLYKNSGSIEIKAENIRIKGVTTNENLAGFNENGSVQLYYDNVEKLATTSTGISVSGTSSTFAGNILMGNTVVNPASGFADQAGIGLKYSTTVPELQVSSDSIAMELGRTTTGGDGDILSLRKAGTVVHTFQTNNVSIGTNATFAGDINISAGKKLQYSANSFITPENNVTGAEISTAGDFRVKTGSTPTLALTIGGTQNATFAGNSITVDPASGDAILQLQSSTQTLRVDQNSIRTSTNTNLSFLTNSTLALTLDTSQNSTFAGDITTSQQLRSVGADTQTGATVSANLGIKLQNTSNTDGNFQSIDFFNSTGFVTGRIAAQFQDAGNRNTDLYFCTRPNGGSLQERMRIDSSGNVGIGVTPYSYSRLTTEGSDNTSSNYAFIAYQENTNAILACRNDGQVTIPSGNLGIGTTPDEKLDVQGKILVGDYFKLGSTATYMGQIGLNRNIDTGALYNPSYGAYQIQNYLGDLQFQIYNSSGSGVCTHEFFNSGDVFFDGDVGIGDTSPSYELDVDGTIRATGDVIAYSDKRVKENIKTIDNALNKVDKLRGVEFNKIGEDKKSIGVIAQEIEKVIPEVVREDDKGMKSVAYGNITGVLIEAIKELKAEIEVLKNKPCVCNNCNCK